MSAICAPAPEQIVKEQINVFEGFSMADEGHLVIVSIFGDLICVGLSRLGNCCWIPCRRCCGQSGLISRFWSWQIDLLDSFARQRNAPFSLFEVALVTVRCILLSCKPDLLLSLVDLTWSAIINQAPPTRGRTSALPNLAMARLDFSTCLSGENTCNSLAYL